MRVFLKSLLSLLFSLCLAIPLLNTPAHAQPIDDPSAVLMPVKDKALEQDLVQKTLQALHSGDIQTKSKESDFKTSEITVLQVGTEKKFYSATVPITGESTSELSGLTIVYDSEFNVQDSTETIVYKNPEANTTVSSYRDGILHSSVATDVKFTDLENDLNRTNPELLKKNQISPQGWGEKIGCVAATLGVTAAVAKIIVAMCGTSCAAAATGVGAAICAACITGIVGLGGISVTAIAHCFTL